jgi:hypothetical protein
MAEIHKREDRSPEKGEHEYGDVKYADPTNKAYPIDTPEHIRAANSYLHQERNASKYSASERATMMGRIRSAASAHGIKITG